LDNKAFENINKFMHYKFNTNHVQMVSCPKAKKLMLLPLKLHESLTTIITRYQFWNGYS